MQLKSGKNAIVAGFVARDAEFREVGDRATPLTKFAVKAFETGTGQERVTHWCNVVCWRDAAYAAQEIRKGDYVLVAGTLQEREYEGKTYTDLVAEFVSVQGAAKQAQTAAPDAGYILTGDEIDDGDLPF